MFYKKVTSRDHKWFFLLRYGDLKEGLEMWSSRSLKWQYFDYQQSRRLTLTYVMILCRKKPQIS